MEKVVIIGSGCAGLTAALYTARANLRPIVVTGRQPGGLLTTTTVVENYPGFPEGIDGYELMVRMQKQAERFGARIQFGTLEAAELSHQPFVLTIDGERVETETVIIPAVPAIATWAWTANPNLRIKVSPIVRHATAHCRCFASKPWSWSVGETRHAKKQCT